MANKVSMEKVPNDSRNSEVLENYKDNEMVVQVVCKVVIVMENVIKQAQVPPNSFTIDLDNLEPIVDDFVEEVVVSSLSREPALVLLG